MAQTVDIDGNPVETASASDAARELLGDEAESTSAQEPEDAEIPEDPDEVSLEASEGEDTDESELEAAAEETKADTSKEGLRKLEEHINSTYNGDVDAYIKGWHENQARMKEFSNELKELREALQRGKFEADSDESEPEAEIEVAADSDVTFHTENIQSLEQEATQAEQYAKHYLQEAGKAQLMVERIEGKLEIASEDDLPALRQELASAQRNVDSLMSKSSDSEKEARNLQKQLKSEQRSLKAAERQAEQERQQFRNQRQQQRQAEQKIMDDAGETFSKTAKSLINKYSVPKDAAKSQYETLRALVSSQIRSLGPNAPLQDIEALTNAVGEAYFESLDSITRAKFGKASKTKLKATSGKSVKSQNSASPAPTKKHRRDMTQADWEELAARQSRYYDSL